MEKEEKRDSHKNNDFGVASVVLGIMSLVNSLFVPIAGIILGIAGLVFSSKQKKVFSNKWSRNGKILNLLGIILGIISLIVTIYLIANNITGQLAQLNQLGA